MSGWWMSLYDDLFGEFFLDRRDPDEAERAVDFLLRVARLREGDAVFDQGAGNGRLMVPMLQRGLRVHGVDANPHYVEQARTACAGFGARASVSCGDMATEGPPFVVDAVVSWWTTLGYWEHDDDNLRPLVRAFAALRPGGTFVLDTMNVAQLLGAVRALETDTFTRGDDTVTLVRESVVDLAAGVLRKTWTWTLPDGRRLVHPSAVRLYLAHEWARLLKSAGFVDVEFFGDEPGAVLSLASARCRIVARRPE
jgi:SAM-dependent methyltransferase